MRDAAVTFVPSDVSPSLRSLLDAAPRAFVATEPDGTVVLWNKAAERFYGWAEEEAIGADIVDLLVPRALTRDAQAILPIVSSGGRWSGEFFVRRKGGGTVRVLTSLWPLTNTSGEVVGIVGESEEVTAEQLLDAELRAGESLLLGLQDGNLGSWYWDTTTGSVTWDTALEALHGLAPGGFGGTFDDWMALVHPDDRDATRVALHRLRDVTETYQAEHRVCWPDGFRALAAGPGAGDPGRARCRRGRGRVCRRPHRAAGGGRGPRLEAEHDARVAAEDTASRLAGLQAVTAALARALDPAEVAEAVFVDGLAHLGGNTASLCLVAPDGKMVDIVHEIGYSDDVKQEWQSFPLAAPLPASDAIRSGEPVLLRSWQERDRLYPVFVGTPMVGSQAHAIVPLPDEAGTPFGALVVGFEEPRDFDAADRSHLVSLASLCAGALRRARLFEVTRAAMEAEQAARRAAEKATERLAFMAEASSTLASFLDYRLTLSQVVDLAVPRLADWCAVHLVRDDGRIRPLAVAHVDPERVVLVRDLMERYPPDPDTGSGAAAVIRTGRPEVQLHVTEELVAATVADREQRDLINRVGLGSVAVFPLRARGRVLGALSLATDRGSTFSDDSLSLAQELAVRASVAIDNALLFEDRSRIARRLQASLLPAHLPHIPGLDVGPATSPQVRACRSAATSTTSSPPIVGAGRSSSATCVARGWKRPPSPASPGSPSGPRPSAGRHRAPSCPTSTTSSAEPTPVSGRRPRSARSTPGSAVSPGSARSPWPPWSPRRQGRGSPSPSPVTRSRCSSAPTARPRRSGSPAASLAWASTSTSTTSTSTSGPATCSCSSPTASSSATRAPGSSTTTV